MNQEAANGTTIQVGGVVIRVPERWSVVRRGPRWLGVPSGSQCDVDLDTPHDCDVGSISLHDHGAPAAGSEAYVRETMRKRTPPGIPDELSVECHWCRALGFEWTDGITAVVSVFFFMPSSVLELEIAVALGPDDAGSSYLRGSDDLRTMASLLVSTSACEDVAS